MYNVQRIYLSLGIAYYITATYEPMSDSPALFGGLQEIMNSFKLIKGD